jgi:hypothetical protein
MFGYSRSLVADPKIGSQTMSGNVQFVDDYWLESGPGGHRRGCLADSKPTLAVVLISEPNTPATHLTRIDGMSLAALS